MSFFRLPRLLYAFAEAFVRPELRIEQTSYFVLSSDSTAVPDLKRKPGFITAVQKLNDAGFSFQTGQSGTVFWKNIRPEDMTPASFEELLRMTSEVVRVLQQEPLVIPVQQVESEKKCAYCKEELTDTASVQYCTNCGTPHHTDCFALNGQCTVFGCGQQRIHREDAEYAENRN